MDRKEFITRWDKAKNLCGKDKFDEAFTELNSLVLSAENLEKIYIKKDFSSKEDFVEHVNFYKAMFFGDLAGVLSDMRDFEEALKISKKALFHKEQAQASTLIFIYYNRGLIYLHKREYENALKWFDKVIYENEVEKIFAPARDIADYYAGKAEALYFLEKYEESEQFFLKSISIIDNKDIEPFYFLSKLYKLKNDEKKSKKYYKMYLTRRNKLSDEEFKKRIKYCAIEFI